MKENLDKLKQLIRSIIKEILTEERLISDEGIDISRIPINDLKQGYKDLRLVPTLTNYDDVLCQPATIKEAYGDIMPPEDVIKTITSRYGLPETFAKKVENRNNIYVYLVVAHIGVNENIIIEDMQKLGYFLGQRKKSQVIDGMEFCVLQFEPTSQLQDDETEAIKNKYKTLYHWTPSYLVKNILSKGLVPTHKNEKFNFPNRTYLMRGDSDDRMLIAMGQELCIFNSDNRNNGSYTLLGVDITNLDDTVRFYLDPNSSIGIYTEQVIPSNNIKVIAQKQFTKDLKNGI